MEADGVLVVVVPRRLAPSEVARFSAEVCARLAGDRAPVVVCDVGALTEPDAVAIDALARLRLATRRQGRELRFRHASRALVELLGLAGLLEVLPLCGSVVESERQVEEREERRCVEEEADPGDLAP